MVDMIFADVAEKVLAGAQHAPEGGMDADLWARLAETGLDRLLLPEDQGGAGDAFAEAASVMIAFGRSGAALPLADTMVANWCLSRAGHMVAEGPKALLCMPDLRRVGADWVGPAYWLPELPAAVLLEGDGTRVALIETALSGTRGQSVAGEPLLHLAPNGQLAAAGWMDTTCPPGQALALAATLEAAALVGAMEAAAALAIDYANTRKQFGRAIGRFQAVQFLVARLASEVAAARAAVEQAANRLHDDSAPFWAAVAKARASEAGGKVAAQAHQIHGAIGYTREYQLHRLTRRIWSWRERRGNETFWNDRIGTTALGSAQDGIWAGLVDGFRI